MPEQQSKAVAACLSLLERVDFFRSLNEEQIIALAKSRSPDLLHSFWAHPDFKGAMFGREGAKCLDDLAAAAQDCNEELGLSVHSATVRRTIEWQFCDRFLKHGQRIDARSVDSMLKRASTHALRKRKSGRIAVPCRVTDDSEPEEFEACGMQFVRTAAFVENMPETKILSFQSSKRSLEEMPWVAIVRFRALDPALARERAFAAVRATLELLTALLDPFRGDRLTTSHLPSIPRTSLSFESIDDSDWSTSWESSGLQAAFGDGWYDYLRNELGDFLDAGGRAVAGLLVPHKAHPLEQRFLDALHWFGLACRETSPASRISACVFALERLCMTRETKDLERIGRAFAQRTTVLAIQFEGYPAIKWFPQLVDLYDTRSRLAHGDISPNDPRVPSSSVFALCVTRAALLGSLAVYSSLSSGLGTEPDLKMYFDRLAPEDPA